MYGAFYHTLHIRDNSVWGLPLMIINRASCSHLRVILILLRGTTIMETEEIVKRTKANDAAALAMLVEAYSSKARAVCFGITHEDEELRLVMAPSTFNNNIIIPRSTFNIQNFFSLPFFIYICNINPTALLTHLQTTLR